MLESIGLTLPGLAPSLEGLRIAHLSDLHLVRDNPAHAQMLRSLARRKLDFVCLTGDYINRGGPHEPALGFLKALTSQVRPQHGFFGVFGNHDSPAFRNAADALPIQWLENQGHRVPGLPLILSGIGEMLGRCEAGDMVALALNSEGQNPCGDGDGQTLPTRDPILHLALAHSPGMLVPAADLRINLLLCGHTHGGQVRLPSGNTTIRCGLPVSQVAGLLRHRNTYAAVSRGMGHRPGTVRIFCPRQLPVYTLHSGPGHGHATHGIENVMPW